MKKLGWIPKLRLKTELIEIIDWYKNNYKIQLINLTMLKVSKPSIPDKKLFQKYLKEIFNNRILTNNGPIVKKFEKQLKKNLI